MNNEDLPSIDKFKSDGICFRITRKKDTGIWIVENKDKKTFYKDIDNSENTLLDQEIEVALSGDMEIYTADSENVCVNDKEIDEYTNCADPVEIHIIHIGYMYSAVDNKQRYGQGVTYVDAINKTPAIRELNNM